MFTAEATTVILQLCQIVNDCNDF